MASARKTMKDTSSPQILQRLITTELERILRASRNENVHIYLTGYPSFFNAATPDCNQVTFYYWHPDRGAEAYGPRLTTQLRRQLNTLTTEINAFLSTIVTDLNKSHPRRFTFVDPNPAFDGHRFCEPGVREPDPHRADTWFFLSGWDDVPVGGTPAVAAAEHHDAMVKAEHEEIVGKGRVELPDPGVCLSEGGADVAGSFLFSSFPSFLSRCSPRITHRTRSFQHCDVMQQHQNPKLTQHTPPQQTGTAQSPTQPASPTATPPAPSTPPTAPSPPAPVITGVKTRTATIRTAVPTVRTAM